MANTGNVTDEMHEQRMREVAENVQLRKDFIDEIKNWSLDEAKTSLAGLDTQIGLLNFFQAQLKRHINDIYVAQVKQDHPTAQQAVVGEYWNCTDSPFGKCAYDPEQDTGHDQCLYCGEPEERK